MRTHSLTVGGVLAVCGLALSVSALAQAPASSRPAPKDDKTRINISDQNTVDIGVRDEDVRAVLEMLAVQSRKNIIASKGVQGKVSADLFGVTFAEAMDSLLQVNGFGWRQRGNFIFVYTKEEMDKLKQEENPRVAKVIRLSYLNTNDASELVKPMLSQGGEIKTTKATENFSVPDSGPTGKDDFAFGATLVVVDFPENIAAIEKLLSELDTKPQQVLVETTVMRTILNEQNAMGVDFSIIGDLNFTDFATVGGPFGAASALARGTGSGSSAGFSPPNNRGFAVGSGLGATSGPATLRVGVISNNLSLVVKLLDQVTDTSVLANPKLLVLNRQPSRVQVLQRLPYLSSTINEGGSRTETVQFLDIGVNLFFRPFVSSTGDIRMELKPQISDGTLGTIRGSSGEVTAPFESRQEITTNVIVRDGMTIVLGGLFRETVTANRSQVPLLGDVPIVGNAFRGRADETQREEIIFLVTPSIVSDKTLISQAERSFESINRVRAGTRQGLLFWSRDKLTSSLNLEAEKMAREGDVDGALWKINRSLTLNPKQDLPQQMRERLTGQREIWPSNNVLDEVINGEIQRRVEAINPAQGTWRTPENSLGIPRQPLNAPQIPAPMPAPAPAPATGKPQSAAPTATGQEVAQVGVPIGEVTPAAVATDTAFTLGFVGPVNDQAATPTTATTATTTVAVGAEPQVQNQVPAQSQNQTQTQAPVTTQTQTQAQTQAQVNTQTQTQTQATAPATVKAAALTPQQLEAQRRTLVARAASALGVAASLLRTNEGVTDAGVVDPNQLLAAPKTATPASLAKSTTTPGNTPTTTTTNTTTTTQTATVPTDK
jgi:type IV pilus assembly protein PilQ